MTFFFFFAAARVVGQSVRPIWAKTPDCGATPPSAAATCGRGLFTHRLIGGRLTRLSRLGLRDAADVKDIWTRWYGRRPSPAPAEDFSNGGFLGAPGGCRWREPAGFVPRSPGLFDACRRSDTPRSACGQGGPLLVALPSRTGRGSLGPSLAVPPGGRCRPSNINVVFRRKVSRYVVPRSVARRPRSDTGGLGGAAASSMRAFGIRLDGLRHPAGASTSWIVRPSLVGELVGEGRSP